MATTTRTKGLFSTQEVETGANQWQVQVHTISSTIGTRMLRMATLDANSVVMEAASVIRNMSAGAGRLLRPLSARDSVFVRPVFCTPESDMFCFVRELTSNCRVLNIYSLLIKFQFSAHHIITSRYKYECTFYLLSK